MCLLWLGYGEHSLRFRMFRHGWGGAKAQVSQRVQVVSQQQKCFFFDTFFAENGVKGAFMTCVTNVVRFL